MPSARHSSIRRAGDMAIKAGVARETAPGERRVALTPDMVAKLQAAAVSVLVERGAGEAASFLDAEYADAGATIVTQADLYSQADVILRINKPSAAEARLLRSGQVVVGLMAPLL